MNVKQIKWQTYNRQFFFYGLLLLMFSIPLFKAVFSPIVILLSLTWILGFDFKEKWNSFKKDKVWLFGLISIWFYLLHCISVLYSDNKPVAFFDLEVKMMFWIAPILFLTLSEAYLTLAHLYKIFMAFILGCFLSIILSSSNSLFNFLNTGDISNFYYSRLSLFHHTSYGALYHVFSLFLIFFMLYIKPIPYRRWVKILLFIYAVFATVYVLLLQSKSGYLSLGFAFVFLMVCSFLEKKKKIAIYMLVLFLIGILTLSLFPSIGGRLKESKEAITRAVEHKTAYPTSTTYRLEIWDNSITLFEKAPLFGYGIGDIQDKLNDSYRQYAMKPALEQQLNPHNQLLQTMLGLGLVGLCSLLLLIFYPVYYTKNGVLYLLTLFFSLLITGNLLVESMLEVQAGISFFTIFICLLVKYGRVND